MTPGISDRQVIQELHLLDQQLEVRHNSQWQLKNVENQEKLKLPQGRDGQNAKILLHKVDVSSSNQSNEETLGHLVALVLIIKETGQNQVAETGKPQKLSVWMVTDDLPEAS